MPFRDPAAEAAARPVSVAELARALGVGRSTLWRALRFDPAAPAPDAHDDLDRPLYRPEPVTAWWPNRRTRGRPAGSSAETSRGPARPSM